MSRSIITFAALSLALGLATMPVAASVGGGGGAGGAGIHSDAQVVRTLKMVIKDVGPDNQITLFDPATEQEHQVVIDDRVKLRAKSKKLFDGRKTLVAGDLARGQTVRLAVRADSGRILQLTVLSVAA